MAASDIHIIVNPRSAGGRTAKRWPKILNQLLEKLGPVTYSFTEAQGDGSAKTKAALEDGAGLIVVVGGDGTFSEAVNGAFKNAKPINPEAEIAFITSGTGCDIRRAHNWPEAKDFSAMIDIIASGESRAVDIGHMTLQDHAGNETERHFANAASFGVGGAVSHAVNSSRIAKKFGGTAAFAFHALREALRFQNQPVRLQVDDTFDEELNIILGVAAIGPYFGGGLKIAPDADPCDGLFDILIGHDITKAQIPGLFSRIYSGKHVQDPKVKSLKGRRLIATPVDQKSRVLLEVDGEAPGALRSEITLLPGVLRLRG